MINAFFSAPQTIGTWVQRLIHTISQLQILRKETPLELNHAFVLPTPSSPFVILSNWCMVCFFVNITISREYVFCRDTELFVGRNFICDRCTNCFTGQVQFIESKCVYAYFSFALAISRLSIVSIPLAHEFLYPPKIDQ